MRVLLVEDNVDHAHLVQHGLEEEQFIVTHVRTGADAIDHATQNPVEACLVDYRLPDRRGTEVCQTLRAKNPSGLMLLVTSVTRDDIVEQAFEAGVDDYIVKGPGLMERIKQHLETYRESGR